MMYKKKEVPTQSIGTRIGFSLLKSYFDMIPHEGLIKRLSEKRGSDAEHRNQDKWTRMKTGKGDRALLMLFSWRMPRRIRPMAYCSDWEFQGWSGCRLG